MGGGKRVRKKLLYSMVILSGTATTYQNFFSVYKRENRK